MINYQQFLEEMRQRRQDWYNILNSINRIIKSLPGTGRNMVKSEIIDRCVAHVIDDFEYIDQKGCDYLYKNNYRVEGKTSMCMFKQDFIEPVKVYNYFRGSLDFNLFLQENTFDAMLLISKSQNKGVGIVSRETVKQYAYEYGDGIMSKIPIHKVDFIINPNEKLEFDESYDSTEITSVYDELINKMVECICQKKMVSNIGIEVTNIELIKTTHQKDDDLFA